jgi:hypothetical protein
LRLPVLLLFHEINYRRSLNTRQLLNPKTSDQKPEATMKTTIRMFELIMFFAAPTLILVIAALTIFRVL